jgi:hypothetical protein
MNSNHEHVFVRGTDGQGNPWAAIVPGDRRPAQAFVSCLNSFHMRGMSGVRIRPSNRSMIDECREPAHQSRTQCAPNLYTIPLDAFAGNVLS